MAVRFDGQIAIVTGAGSGLGRSYAHLLAERGATVVCNDLGGSRTGRGKSTFAADEVVKEIKAKGGKAVANYDDVKEGDKIVAQAIKEFGRVDIIINNAGIGRSRPFDQFTDEDWNLVYETHVTGSYKVVKAAWPHMENQKYGRIVNISSPTGLYGMYPVASYCAAKAGLHGFTLTLAREGAKYNIKVNSLAPNAQTRLSGNPSSLFGVETVAFMDPYESIAPTAAFLSHESCPSTGHFFECGAGWIARTRIERSRGVEFNPNSTFTPASIKEKFQEICDFKDAVIPEEVQAGPGGEDTMTRLARVTKLPAVVKDGELSFKDRVVLITGAGAGLGRAYAHMFAKAGAKVVVNDLGGGRFGEDEKAAVRPADVVVEEIRKAGGTAVANYDSVLDGEKVVDTAIKAFGRIDIVINNAGILRDKSFKRMTDQDWFLIQEVHAKGPYKIARAAWPYFVKQRFGRLINTTSSVGLYGNFGQANYSTAKLSNVGLSNELAIEGKKYNISVNTLAPGAGTRLTATVMTPEVVEAMKPDFVAPLVGYLVHPEVFETAGIYESASGWNAKVRWQRTGGAYLPVPHTIEDVRDNWKVVNDFKDGRVEYPETLYDTAEAMKRAAYFQIGLRAKAGAKL